MTTLALAEQGVYRTVQGEGALIGVPMVFVRLAGCSVGCSACDTNYRVHRRATVEQIAEECVIAAGPVCDWIWLTGGEPTDQDIVPLITQLHSAGFLVALATAGTRSVQCGCIHGGVDFLSVSPHGMTDFVQRTGDQVNCVIGLNDLKVTDIADQDFRKFTHRFVTACAGKPETLQECIKLVITLPGWRLGVQAHLHWGLP